MNVFKSMFGVCSSSGTRGEVHDTIRKIFGNEMLVKDNNNLQAQRSKYVIHVKENLAKVVEIKLTPKKGSKKHSGTHTPEIYEVNEDNRPGRVGPKIVVFDATTGTGRLILVGDERVSVQGISSFATIRATSCVFSGKWMYEVQLGTKGIMQIGWCTSACSFSMDTGVGDTSHSYAYDGGRVRRWNVVTSEYGESWLPGDVIGSCINLDKGTLEFYRNGKSLGVAFDKVCHGSGLAYFPAVSLAMQEHLYANFGHVPFVFPIDGYAPLQLPPTKECARAAVLFKFIDSLLDEFVHPTALRPVSNKASKVKMEQAKTSEDEVALKIHSEHSMYTAKPSPRASVDSANTKLMSRKAFLMSITRIVIMELGLVLKTSYVVIAELLPRFRALLGLHTPNVMCESSVRDFYLGIAQRGYVDLAKKMLAQPQLRLCTLLDWLWTFLDESALCDIIEHCVVRECLLYDLVSQDMQFKRQIEVVYVLCGLMQHRETRHHLVKYVFFSKISFDNFLNVKCPDEKILRTIIRDPWWKRPTPVVGESDSKINDKEDKESDDVIEKRYKEDCARITAAIAPLEQIQLEFLLMLLDNNDGNNIVPSTRKIFMEKFRRYIMDNCILDMIFSQFSFRDVSEALQTSWSRRDGEIVKIKINSIRLFNVSRNTPAISWCCHDRLLMATLKLWQENPLGNKHFPIHIPTNSFLDGELDYYNVDRLGGVLPFLVRTLRQDLVNVLGEDNLFIQSFEPVYNRSGGLDTDVMAAGSLRTATLPQVISSMARFLQPQMSPIPLSRNPDGTVFSMKGSPSTMPGSGRIDIKLAYLRLVDGLLALYHGAAVKYDEKLCEVRDNQLDMADCLHDIEQRIQNITKEIMNPETPTQGKLSPEKKEISEKILLELERSKSVYVEKLETSALQMGWIIGAVWTKRRQQNLTKQFAGVLHSMRLASDSSYASEIMVSSKEILQDKSSMLGNSSYASLELEYTSSSDQSPTTPASTTTPGSSSHNQVQQGERYAASLFAFVPEYHVDTLLELCNTLRLYMHPTVPVHQIPEWEELVVSCATFLCSEFADHRIVLASTRECLVQTLASFATQTSTMRAIERVSQKQQMCMIEQLLKPYQNRAWAQSNWVLVRFWHGAGFGFHHRQWPHLAAKYGDREPTVNNLGAKVDAGLMSQCFGPCPSEVMQSRIREYITKHPKESGVFLNSLLSQLNWAFSEFITMMQEMDRVVKDTQLEARQVKLCATCFDLYHGLCRALEMALNLTPYLLTKPEVSDNQNELLLGRTCQILMAVLSRVCVRSGGGAAFARLVARGLPEMDRVHYYAALAPVAGCLIGILDSKLSPDHLSKVTKALVTEPLFQSDALEFMVGRGKKKIFSFYDFPDDVNPEEMQALEIVIERLRFEKETKSPGSSAQSELLCTICYARPADTRFVPCGHQSCKSCVMQHLLNNNQCFFCKSEIEEVKEVDINS